MSKALSQGCIVLGSLVWATGDTHVAAVYACQLCYAYNSD